ncbi:hypothetical protein ABEB36_002579 [Hypothenemus hampei]|uniref:Uncharacterized protein n=1 Tax=Hypothenemus hampei TaxID=57062 RepID=A0ABD1F694_HYPHA
MLPSTKTLLKYSAIGGVATVIMGVLARGKIENNVKTAPFYKEAMKTLRGHAAAVYLLGEPIKDGKIDVGNNKKNFIDGNAAQFVVPLRGAKQRGIAYIYASKEDNDEQWSLSRIELEVNDRPDQRLVIKKC